MPKALVVDDSAATRRILCHMLREFGYEVVEAEDGTQAWQTLKHQGAAIELLLADWNMPGMDGLSLVKRVRENPAFLPMVVIMVTAENDVDRIEAALEAGA